MTTRISSGLASETEGGFSRAVQVGNRLYTSASAAVNEALEIVGEDGAEQTRYILDRLQAVFAEAGFSFQDVVAVTLYVVDDPRAESAYEVYREYFADVKPTLAIVRMVPWPNPDMLVEVQLLAERDPDEA